MSKEYLQLDIVIHIALFFIFRKSFTVQGLPVFIGGAAVLAILGWTSLKARIEKRRLLILWKILALNMDNIYKKICIERLIRLRGKSNNFLSHCPIALMYKVCVKYGLDVHVMDILNSKIIGNAAWKGLVNSAIMGRENTMWSISICLYSSLRLYRSVFYVAVKIVWNTF